MTFNDRAPFVRRNAPDDGCLAHHSSGGGMHPTMALRGRMREANPRRAHHLPFQDRAPLVPQGLSVSCLVARDTIGVTTRRTSPSADRAATSIV